MRKLILSSVAIVALSVAAPAVAQQGQPGGEIVVTYKDDVATLDPAIGYDWQNWSMIKSLFDGLMDYEPGTATLRPDLAESYLRKAVKAADDLAKPDEAAQRNALVRSGKFYLGQNRPAEALPLLERAAAISERNPGLQRTLHAIDLDNVGIAHSNQGRLAEGRAFGLRALEVLDEAQGEPAAAATRGVVLFNLAYGYMEESRYAEAEANYRRSLEILAPGGSAPIAESWRARVLIDSYAGMLRKLGRTDEAAALARRKEQLNRR